MLSPIIKKVLQSLADAPTLAIAHERLALGREHLERVEEERNRLLGENVELRRQLALRMPVEFTEHRGVLWKRLSNGGFAEDPYCPQHRVAMSRFAGEVICTAHECNYAAPFDYRQQPEAHASIPKDRE
jgi:hypothetical protein